MQNKLHKGGSRPGHEPLLAVDLQNWDFAAAFVTLLAYCTAAAAAAPQRGVLSLVTVTLCVQNVCHFLLNAH